jgi:GTP-binding protein
MTGADGVTLVLRVPVGTQVYDDTTGELIADLATAGAEVVVARGGRGGKGNAFFATPSRRTPDFAQPGEPGEERELRLELKLIADVGLVGFPNAGKSTLVNRVSRARPKIADYPFTTLRPHLGVVRVDDERSYVIADLPGLIEGASDGAGLGLQFLRHIERTSLFLFLITQDVAPGRDPVSDFRTLRRELGAYDAALLERPYLVVLSQIDRTEVREQLDDIRAALGPEAGEVLALSAVTGEGVPELLVAIARRLVESGRWAGD